MYPRYSQRQILAALKDTPVIFIAGPRQCGKTTLAKSMLEANWQYISFDDITQLEMAQRDPAGYIRNLSARHIVLDEVQRVPELFLPIKQSVDEDRKPGRFILTGSANALLLPQLSEPLVGRLEVFSLLPLAECEIQERPSTFIEKLLSGTIPTSKVIRARDILIDKIVRGGFPEAIARKESSRSTAWHLQYINNIIQRDLESFSQLEHLDAMPRLIRALCAQTGKLINYTELAGRVGLSRQTMIRYEKLLEQLYLFENLPAWHHNETKRAVKTPKVHIVDTGLLCALQRLNKGKICDNPNNMGYLLENYVINEIKRISLWQDEPLYFYHYRDKDKVEVDLVIETLSGQVIGIEIKSTATLRQKDFQGLEKLKALAGNNFLTGILLYDGDHSNQYSDKIYSSPIGSIWE